MIIQNEPGRDLDVAEVEGMESRNCLCEYCPNEAIDNKHICCHSIKQCVDMCQENNVRCFSLLPRFLKLMDKVRIGAFQNFLTDVTIY